MRVSINILIANHEAHVMHAVTIEIDRRNKRAIDVHVPGGPVDRDD
jgi:hypothetical protein